VHATHEAAMTTVGRDTRMELLSALKERHHETPIDRGEKRGLPEEL
jgi:hypothetical protein